jgi:Transcriptional regulator, AbiEi antitoxin
MDPRLARTSVARGGVFTYSDAIAAGYSPAEVVARLRRGSWRRLRRGVYAGADLVPDLAPLAAALAVLPARAALSHRSAAVVHGLPLVGTQVPVAEVTVPGAAARRRRDLVVHGRPLPEDHVEQRHGLRVTTAARTAVDIARLQPFHAAVATVDAAVRTGVPKDLLDRLVASEVGPFSRRARRVVAFADARAESPGESLSRVAIAGHGLPAPELQAPIHDASGSLVGRVDFLWREHRTIGEFDGKLKYVTPDSLWDEKRREDALRELGFTVVRWVWRDVWGDFTATAARLRAAFALSSARASRTV